MEARDGAAETAASMLKCGTELGTLPAARAPIGKAGVLFTTAHSTGENDPVRAGITSLHITCWHYVINLVLAYSLLTQLEQK